MRREAAHAIIAAKRKWTENNGGIIMEFIREESSPPITVSYTHLTLPTT